MLISAQAGMRRVKFQNNLHFIFQKPEEGGGTVPLWDRKWLVEIVNRKYGGSYLVSSLVAVACQGQVSIGCQF